MAYQTYTYKTQTYNVQIEFSHSLIGLDMFVMVYAQQPKRFETPNTALAAAAPVTCVTSQNRHSGGNKPFLLLGVKK